MSPADASTVFSRLAALGAATVHEALGGHDALDAALAPLDPTSTLAGRVVTVDLPPGDNWYLHHGLLRAGPGDVLVVDAHGHLDAGPWGDVLTAAAQQRGLAGLVIDGAVRDRRAILESRFPVFARGLCIKGTTKELPGRLDVAVTVGGVLIHPGDVVVGDADGLVRIPAGHEQRALELAEARAAKEEHYRDELRRGVSTVELLGLRPLPDTPDDPPETHHDRPGRGASR